MTQEWNEEDADFGEGQARGRPVPLRLRQMRVEAQVQMAETQKMMARAMTKSAGYMLWAVVACSASAVITVIAVLYGLVAVLPRVTH